MARLKNYILPPDNVNEAAYFGNIGFEELMEFYKKANRREEFQMKKIIERGDWEAFRKMIKTVTGKELK